MFYYTAEITYNNSTRTMLICKSKTPVTFEDLEHHRQVSETENQVTTTTYTTEPVICNQAYDEPYYYYWFILKRVEAVVSVTNEEKIKKLEEDFTAKDLDNKMALAEVYEMMLSSGGVI